MDLEVLDNNILFNTTYNWHISLYFNKDISVNEITDLVNQYIKDNSKYTIENQTQIPQYYGYIRRRSNKLW